MIELFLVDSYIYVYFIVEFDFMTVILLVDEGVICCCLQATVADLQEAIHKRSK